MILKVVATGSRANCYVLDADGQSLILDAGVTIGKVLPYVADVRRIVGCLITHEHGDHARGLQGFLCRGIPTAMSKGTADALSDAFPLCSAPLLASALQPIRLGGFTVMPFPTQHDAAEPFGFLVRYEPTGETLVYATDTYYIRYTFPNVHYWVVECNYCDECLNGETNAALRHRLKESHMSLKRLKDTLQANDLRKTRTIVLVHLSDARSDERHMVEEIHAMTGIETVAADNGKIIHLDLVPF